MYISRQTERKPALQFLRPREPQHSRTNHEYRPFIQKTPRNSNSLTQSSKQSHQKFIITFTQSSQIQIEIITTMNVTWSVFPRPISSAMRHRAPLLNANRSPSCWKGSNTSRRVLGSFAIRRSTSSSGKCSGRTGVHRPAATECERRSTTLNVAQGISSTCSASASAFNCLTTAWYSVSLNTQTFTPPLVCVKCESIT